MAARDKQTRLTVDNEIELAPGEVVIGRLQSLSERAEPLVDFPQNTSGSPIVALSTQTLGSEHIGREVALLFTSGDLNRPLIIGLIHRTLQGLIDNFESTAEQTETEVSVHDSKSDELDQIEASIDGKKVVIEGQEEVVLKCGESSITLTRSGKIMIRGKHILNRSTGLNRILGGSVQIN